MLWLPFEAISSRNSFLAVQPYRRRFPLLQMLLLELSVRSSYFGSSRISCSYHAWLLASRSDSMLTRMVGCDYAHQVWEKLEAFFASQTKTRVIQLKTQLRNLRKDFMSISEFLSKLKKIIDSLLRDQNRTLAQKIELKLRYN